MNYNATSSYEDVVLASFNASVNEPNNNSYISINIDNMTAFTNNIAIAKTDLASFIDTIVGNSEE